MKTKIIFTSLIVLAVAVVGLAIFFISRPQPEELLPQKFAELQTLEKPKHIAKFHHRPPIKSVTFSPVDSSIIATADEYGTVKLWNTNDTKNHVRIFSHPATALETMVTFSPSGKLLLSSDYGKVVLWDIATGKKLNSLDGSSGQIAFSPDGNILAIPKALVRLWDVRNPNRIGDLGILPYERPEGVPSWGANALDISTDGKWIAVAHNSGIVNVWDFQNKQLVKTLKPILELERAYGHIETIKFSPDNRYLALRVQSTRCILWTVPEWEYHGQIPRGRIEGMSFSPDGKMFAFANPSSIMGKGIELRLAENGELITTLPPESWDVAFSHNGEMLATGGEDGFLGLWQLRSNQFDLYTTPSCVFKIMYIIGPGKRPIPNITSKLDKTIKEVQQFYADEMERHGFGRKTFTFETDENGKAKIYLIESELTKGLDFSDDTWLAVSDGDTSFLDVLQHNDFSHETYPYSFRGGGTISNNIFELYIEGVNYKGLIDVNTKDLNRDRVAYELRPAFNIPYVYRKRGSNFLTRIFSGGNKIKLSKCEAEWLERNRYFNTNQTFFDNAPEIGLRISPSESAETRNFQFDVSDEDGIHQAQLYVPGDTKYQRDIKKLQDYQSVNGKKKANVVFEITDPKIKNVKLQMIDMLGNIASREFHIKEERTQTDKNE